MGRLLAIDYGLKRTGLAVTDNLKIIATALDTVRTHDLLVFLKQYFAEEEVEAFVLGLPKQLNTQDTHTTQPVKAFEKKLKATFPNTPVHLVDERFTSVIAHRAMLEGGMSKKNRRKKENVDMISATLILQSYMESNQL